MFLFLDIYYLLTYENNTINIHCMVSQRQTTSSEIPLYLGRWGGGISVHLAIIMLNYLSMSPNPPNPQNTYYQYCQNLSKTILWSKWPHRVLFPSFKFNSQKNFVVILLQHIEFNVTNSCIIMNILEDTLIMNQVKRLIFMLMCVSPYKVHSVLPQLCFVGKSDITNENDWFNEKMVWIIDAINGERRKKHNYLSNLTKYLTIICVVGNC